MMCRGLDLECRLGEVTQLGPASGAFVRTWIVGCQGCGLEHSYSGWESNAF